MNFRKLIVPTLCVLLGCAGGAAIGSVTAQSRPEPANAPRWQLECVVTEGSTIRQLRASIDELIRDRGARGWRSTALDQAGRMCFERPAP